MLRSGSHPTVLTCCRAALLCPLHTGCRTTLVSDASRGPVLQVTSARELLAAIDAGQQRRHVSSTQMNRESSRSHLVMSVIIEATNLQTQNVTKGKLSFVDLAGSERRASMPSLHSPSLGHCPGL